ncbi:MAG: hypothetical protein EZS28_021453, partial [Streblomastix strix]
MNRLWVVGDDVSLIWRLDNKYYTADVQVTCSDRSILKKGNELPHAIIFCYEMPQVGSLITPNVQQMMAILKDEGQIPLIILAGVSINAKSNENDTIEEDRRYAAQDWCREREAEFIECNDIFSPLQFTSYLQNRQMYLYVNNEDKIQEKDDRSKLPIQSQDQEKSYEEESEGIERIIETLH